MPIATLAERESLAVKYGADGPYLSLHTADPGTSGTSEVTGGSPAYARKLAGWISGSADGAVTSSVTFDIPAGITPTYVGVWSASSGGVFLDKAVCSAPTFGTQGVLQIAATFTQT